LFVAENGDTEIPYNEGEEDVKDGQSIVHFSDGVGFLSIQDISRKRRKWRKM